jgi:hypothetical protein
MPAKKRAPKPKPEKVIQKEILDWLKETGLLHSRYNAGCAFLGNRMIRLGTIGWPDIIVVVPPNGRFLALEVKSSTGTLRPEQKDFKAALEDSGGYFRVVRSVTDAMHAVAEALGEEQWRIFTGK